MRELWIRYTSLSNEGCEALAALAPSLTCLAIGSRELTHLEGLRWAVSLITIICTA